jgi:NAD(P)-dependent dehydrogenase (short-subunit alcohol dehydrogenase family)
MRVVVVTGGTRGVGYGLGDSFLEVGCGMAVRGRGQLYVDQALAALQANHGGDRVGGHACDVQRMEQVRGLWDWAMDGKRWFPSVGAGSLPDHQVRAALSDGFPDSRGQRHFNRGEWPPAGNGDDRHVDLRQVGESAEWERNRRVFDILADCVETATPWFVGQMLSTNKNGVRITCLSSGRTSMGSMCAPVVRREIL